MEYTYHVIEQVLAANLSVYETVPQHDPRGSYWYGTWSLREPEPQGSAMKLPGLDPETIKKIEELRNTPIEPEKLETMREIGNNIGLFGTFITDTEFLIYWVLIVPSGSFGRRACWTCGQTENVKKCTQCKRAQYCSTECQSISWNRAHKEVCKSWTDK